MQTLDVFKLKWKLDLAARFFLEQAFRCMFDAAHQEIAIILTVDQVQSLVNQSGAGASLTFATLEEFANWFDQISDVDPSLAAKIGQELQDRTRGVNWRKYRGPQARKETRI
jgi:hypothetical protein